MSNHYQSEQPKLDVGNFGEVSAAIRRIPAKRRPVALSTVRTNLRGRRTTAAQVKICDVLLNALYWKRGETRPVGRADLEAATGYCRSTITRALTSLRLHGFILPSQHTREGRHQRNTYTFPYLAEFFEVTEDVHAKLRAGKRLGRRKRLIVPMNWILKDIGIGIRARRADKQSIKRRSWKDGAA